MSRPALAPTHPPPPRSLLALIEYLLYIVFAIDVAVRLRLAYNGEGGLVVDARAVARQYATRGTLIIDLLALLPLDYILIPALYSAPPDEHGARLLSLLGLIRLLRLHRLLAFFRSGRERDALGQL